MKPANCREPNRISSNSANTEEWFYIDEPEKGWIRYQDPSSLWFWWHNKSLGLCELILLQSIANLIDVLNDSSYTFSSALLDPSDSLYSNSHYGHSQCCDSRYGVAFLFPLRLWLRFLRLQRRFARYLGWFHQGAAGMGLDSSGRLWPRALRNDHARIRHAESWDASSRHSRSQRQWRPNSGWYWHGNWTVFRCGNVDWVRAP